MKLAKDRVTVLPFLTSDLASAPRMPRAFNPSNSSFRFDVPGDDDGSAGGDGDDDGKSAKDDKGGEGDKEPLPSDDDGKGKRGNAAKRDAEKHRKRHVKARAALLGLLKRLGKEDDDFEIVGAGTDEDPYRIDGIEELLPSGDDDEEDGKGKKKPKTEDRETARKLRKAESDNKKMSSTIAALTSALEEHAVVSQIRAAAARYHAIDDDNGQFEDVVNGVKKYFKTRIEDHEEDAGKKVVVFEVRDDKGEEWDDANGDMMTPEKVVEWYLAKKPKFVESKFRSGIGAGGSGAADRKIGANPRGAGRASAASNEETARQKTARNLGHLLGPRAAAMAAEDGD